MTNADSVGNLVNLNGSEQVQANGNYQVLSHKNNILVTSRTKDRLGTEQDDMAFQLNQPCNITDQALQETLNQNTFAFSDSIIGQTHPLPQTRVVSPAPTNTENTPFGHNKQLTGFESAVKNAEYSRRP